MQSSCAVNKYIVICELPGCTVFFHIISHERQFFFTEGGDLDVFFFLQRLSEKFLILRRVQREITITDPTGYAVCSQTFTSSVVLAVTYIGSVVHVIIF
jgi:hypothetical protein